ncbi:hypothetical protein Tco_1476648 [Tanacetum coccineum]
MVVEKRFGGNTATKKTQRNLLKQQYENFTASSSEEVMVNGDLVSSVASASTGAEGPISPKTAEQKLARKNELKAQSTLCYGILDGTY